MSCTSPLVAWWYKPEFQESRPGGLSRPVIMCKWQGTKYDYSVPLRVPALARPCLQQYLLPCGKCLACRMANCQQWTFRALCELDAHEVSAFITLTVDDSHMQSVFPSFCLCHRPFQLFMKRLRKEIAPLQVRYIMCGEYGTHTFRPHYHVIVFGWFPTDAQPFHYRGSYVDFTSATIKRLWSDSDTGESYGFHTVALANEQTIRYLVGYVLKKVDLPSNMAVPPYLRVSTRPALGLDFYKKYESMLFAHDADLHYPNQYVYCGRKKIGLPRYFLKKYQDFADNVDYVSLLKARSRAIAEKPPVDKSDLDRLADYLKCVTLGSHKFRENEV